MKAMLPQQFNNLEFEHYNLLNSLFRYNENRKSIIYVSVTLKWNRYLDLHFMIQLE
jgi:hypothetical protein